MVYMRHVVFTARHIACATSDFWSFFAFHQPGSQALQNPVPWGGAAIDGIEMVMARGKCVMIVLGGSRSCSVGSRCGVARHRSWWKLVGTSGIGRRRGPWERLGGIQVPGPRVLWCTVLPEVVFGLGVCVFLFPCLSSQRLVLLDGSAEF